MNVNFFDLNTPTIVALMVSVVLPLLSALIARPRWPGELVGVLTLLLAGATGFFSEWAAAGDGFRWQTAMSTAVLTFGLAVAARYGLWKGTATDARALAFPVMNTEPVAVAPVHED